MQDYRSCTYIDDLTITNPELLATLCLLYDKVFLPHPYEHDPSCEAIMSMSFENERFREIERRNYLRWKDRNAELFKGGALEVLPSPIAVADMPRDLENRLCLQLGPAVRRLSSEDVLYGRTALAMHALYAKSPAPDFATSNKGPRSTTEVSASLASVIVGRNLPLLPALVSEQVMELRERTANTRDGFRLYLASLADDVEARTGAQRPPNEAAEETYRRKIEPALEEHFRRELPEKVQWWADIVKRVAQGVGNVMTIVADPWKLKNYSKLAEGMADFVEKSADHIGKQRSNEQQTFQFIGRLRKTTP